MNNNYKDDMKAYKKIIEVNLDKFIPVQYPEEIFESMRYSVLAGGKRLRPIITLEVVRLLTGSFDVAIPTACAVEMLHTQSLIHDDLPCMDNDDYRRGKLTNHKVFCESTATLAGDALLSFAPQVITKYTDKSVSSQSILSVLDEYFTAAGVYGIIAGQIVDIDSEKKQIDEKTLDYIHEYKTAKLFTFAFKAGAILAGANQKQIEDFVKFSQLFGHAFQIYDDILDEIATLEELGKTPGKDKDAQKNTYTSMYGLDKAKEKVRFLCASACDILKKGNYNSPIFEGILNDITERIS